MTQQAGLLRSQDILDEVCRFFDVTKDELMIRRTFLRISQVRHLCMYLLQKHLGMTLNEVAYRFDRLDHTTVLNGVRRCRVRLATDVEFAKQVALIESYLTGK
jgi:chromosomal replication initiator protein